MSIILLGYLLSLLFLLGGIVEFFIHYWLSALIYLGISATLFLATTYISLGTSLYVIFEDSVYVPRLWRHAKEEIFRLSDVKRVKRVQTFFKDGYYFFVDSGYYYIKKSVFAEIRDKLPENCVFE